MKKFHDWYLQDETIENWEYLIEEEKSLTKRQLAWYLKESSSNFSISSTQSDLSHMFVTNAISCARKVYYSYIYLK